MQRLLRVREILDHPANRRSRLSALFDYVKWNVGRRLLSRSDYAIRIAPRAKVILSNRENYATLAYTCGLYDFEEMSFLIDYLRPGDVFGDFGANVGVYSVLAGSVGARVLSVEPLPETFSRLQENLRLNEVEGRAVRCGLSSSSGTLRFTKARGGLNRVATTTDEDVIDVTVLTLDDLTLETGLVPQLIKIDVEGFELPLLQGGVRSLRSAVAIIIELNGSGRVYGHTDEQVQDFLLHAGFECFDYRPETRELIERKGARRDKLNSIFLNRDFIADVRSRIAPFG